MIRRPPSSTLFPYPPLSRSLVHPVPRPGRRLRPVCEVLATAPRLLGVVLRTPPSLTTGRKQLLELVVFRIAGHPRGCHASLLVATICVGSQAACPFRRCETTRRAIYG